MEALSGGQLLFLASGVVALVGLRHLVRQKLRALCPLAVWVLAFAVLILVPFTRLTIDADYSLHKTDRADIVARVQDGSLKPDTSAESSGGGVLISLGRDEPKVSKSGNDIIVQKSLSGGYYVFFFTFRGVLDNYSGFLYAPDGADPRQFRDLMDPTLIDLVDYGEDWYWASHY